jgi:hypothetical protein
MCQRCHRGEATDRRHFLQRATSALAAAGVLGLFPPRRGAEAAARGLRGPVALAQPASATALQQALPAPLPIPGGEDVGPPLGFIHVFTPGPQGMGLDVEPSLITNFKGFTAFTLLDGRAEGSDGKTYDVHSDLRVMAGEYVVGDGSRHQGTFAFF